MICNFCYRHCDIKKDNVGYCRVRKNINNKIISTNYGFIEAIAIDPIEKKPLYHFLPGTKSLSIAQAGCNFRCDFCQNWQISQTDKTNTSKYIPPTKLIELAKKYKTPSISFTYTEPIVWQDYVIDCALLAKKNSIKTIMVTNGSFSTEALERLSPLIDAFNIDLKGDEKYYREICKGNYDCVVNSIKYLIDNKKHVEVTSLLLEDYHTEDIIVNLAKTLEKLKVKVWHISRFFPNYKMEGTKATSEEYLRKTISIIKQFNIPYIYGGNSIISTPTICPNCNKTLISNRNNSDNIFKETESHIKNNKCIYCNYEIYGQFNNN
ncbi:MAG: AmmeMemoRadiSam system radical SAM enzyme [Pleomorphochaeta sp.]